MAAHPPSGTVTFLLTDLEGSTRMWEQDPVAMKTAMVRHDEILEKAIAANNGFVFSRMGDGMAAAFATARDAVTAAAAFQQALAAEAWRTASPLRARVGLHTDEAVIVDDTGYASLPINRCSRLMTAAHGGQIVVSGATEMLMRGQLPDGFELVDLGEHRLRDLGRPTRIFQMNRDGDRQEFPALRTLDSFPGNLPAQVSSFIGRKADVTRVVKALETSRVVTVTGVGGVGKTRLALQVAADVLPKYRDGAWLVELASVRDVTGVVEVVAEVLRFTGRSGQSLENSLLEMLAQKQALLVLDNCEHMLGPVARLVSRIERECPGIVVLGTSREGMAIDGEQMLALPPLEAGQPDEDIERLIQTDATNLFVERARQVKADFALTDGNSRAVVETCQRLDGVPLAIELAAARVMALSPVELLRRLDRRFQVLAGGRRGAVERHATLRAAIDWSYDLLDEAEQRLLARMSVFSGSCTLEAVEEVCSGDPVAGDAVMDLVAGLVGRSLVVAEDSELGTRYRMLETIRQYGEERLSDSDETEALHRLHAGFYADLSARATENSYGADQLMWAKRIKADRDNILAALANAIDYGDSAMAVQLIANHPLQVRAEGPTGELLAVDPSPVLDMPGAHEQPGYASVLVVAAYKAQSIGDWQSVTELCQKALEADRRAVSAAVPELIDDVVGFPGASRPGPRIEMETCSLQAQNSLASGAYADAIAAYTRAAELATADGFPGLAAIFLAYKVSCSVLGGTSAEAMASTGEEAVALARKSGMPGAMVISLNSLAMTLAERDAKRAKALLRESVELASTPGQEVASGFLTAALVATRLADWNVALALASRTMLLWRWSMALMAAAPSLGVCARALAEDRPEVAGVLRGAAYAAYRRGSTPQSSPGERRGDPSVNFLLEALREAGDIVAAALGEERRQQLRAEGATMSMDEAVSYALANIDPKLLTGPVSVTQN
jgi:predicted ATPase/class 3 adenylate cyclase